jgi:hypothetical protein
MARTVLKVATSAQNNNLCPSNQNTGGEKNRKIDFLVAKVDLIRFNAVGCEMATANVGTDVVEDFVTCGVCLYEYDEEIRKPKFLSCSHTVCFLCVQVFRQKLKELCLIVFHLTVLHFNRKSAEGTLLRAHSAAK